MLAQRLALINIDQRGVVLRECDYQTERDELPVPFHEEEHDGGLQKHHWEDDDEQGARVKALWHLPPQPQRKVAVDSVRTCERGGEGDAHRGTLPLEREAVARAAGGDEISGLGGIVFQFAAQSIDLHIDAAFIAGRAARRERAARHHVAARARKKPQHFAFAFGKSDSFVFAAKIALYEIEVELTEMNNAIFGNGDVAFLASTQQRGDA